jgi:mevalonate pyrophosphate decarboxylase
VPSQECAPVECQERAKQAVSDHIQVRYAKEMDFDVFVTMFTHIGLSWKAILSTSLPNSAYFTVEYYALEEIITLKVYAMTEVITL